VHRPRGSLAVALSLVALAACTTKTPKESDFLPSTAPGTTAPAAVPTVSPLTGLTPADRARAGRVALVVKIDDAADARPQAGINEADVVFEEQVEGGLTRFAAVYQSNDASPVGPVRSARSTDINIASALNRPLFAYSGANKVFLALLRTAPLIDVGFDSQPSDYRTDPQRKAPENLMSKTPALFAHATADTGPPPSLFSYRGEDKPATGAGIAPAAHALVKFGHTQVVYDWDRLTGWRRTQDNSAHIDAVGHQVTPANVIVQFVEYTDTGLKDPAGAPVPVANLVGQGEAWLLSGGQVVKGTWNRLSSTSTTRFTDSAAAPFQLAPGTTWVELAPVGSATVS
jgi:hypothetical protein